MNLAERSSRMSLAGETSSAQKNKVPLPEIEKIVENADRIAAFLKAVSHEGRLLIICHLMTGEKSVTELEELISARQSAVSQQLTRLRLEGLVKPRREGKTIYYRLADERPGAIVNCVSTIYCADEVRAHY